MLLSPYCSGGHVLRPESLRELGTQFLSDVSDKATFSSHPVHTRCPPWPRLGHAPRAISCPRHDGILFSLYYPFKKFRTTWKPACFGRGNGYKAFTQLAREAYRCVPVRDWRCAGTSFLCDGSVFSQMSRSSCRGPSTTPESVLLRRCRVDVNGSEIERWKTHLDSFGYLLTWISILHLYWQGSSHLKDSKTTETSKTRHQHWWQKKTPTPMLNSSVIASRHSSLCSPLQALRESQLLAVYVSTCRSLVRDLKTLSRDPDKTYKKDCAQNVPSLRQRNRACSGPGAQFWPFESEARNKPETWWNIQLWGVPATAAASPGQNPQWFWWPGAKWNKKKVRRMVTVSGICNTHGSRNWLWCGGRRNLRLLPQGMANCMHGSKKWVRLVMEKTIETQELFPRRTAAASKG